MAVVADVTRLDTLCEMVDDSDIGKIIELLSQMVCWHRLVPSRSHLSFLTHEQGVHTNHRRVTITR